MTSSCGRFGALRLAGALLFTGTRVLAADPADVAAAEALFAEGRQLMAAEDYVAACPKFAESLRLDPGTGTALNLAECYERQGRTATAWGTWLEAATLARQAGQTDREQFARERAKNLESRLHRLVIVVPEANRVEGLRITRSGVEVRAGAWGTPLPLDPGEYTLVFSAPGKVTQEQTVVIAAGPGQTEVTAPLLADAEAVEPSPGPSPVLSSPPADTARSGGSARRTVGIVIASVGAGTLAAGGFFGLRAMSLNDESKEHCRTETLCSPRGVSLRKDALSAGNTATILAGVGGALAATGIVLWITAPSAESPQLGAVSTGDGGQFVLRGSF